MTPVRLRLEHALFTDPMVSQSSGYQLVAQSQGVDSEDAALLAAYPLITDYLHLEEKPGHYFAFHPLRSGRWTFTHRFAQGRRRGNFNRIVVHAIVLDSEDLDLLCQDPWLLLSGTSYGERQLRLTALGADLAADFQGKSGPGQILPALEAQLAGNPADERWKVVFSRFENLVGKQGVEATTQRLAEVLTALASGSRLLWPQGPSDTQQLLAAWSMLPSLDRKNRSFTTHLNTNAASLFQLASTPNPEREIARVFDSGQKGGDWRLHDDLPPPARWARDLCSFLDRMPEDFRSLAKTADEQRWTLSRDGERMGWASYIALHGGRAGLLRSIQQPRDLEAFLDRRQDLLSTSRGRDLNRLAPTERPSFALAVAASGLAGFCQKEDPAVAVPTFADILRRRAPDLLDAGVVESAEQLFASEADRLCWIAAVALVVGEESNTATQLDRLAAIWSHHRVDPEEQSPLDHYVCEDLAVHTAEKQASSSGIFWAQISVDDESTRSLVRRIRNSPDSRRRRRLVTGGLRAVQEPKIALELAQDLAPDLLDGRREDGLAESLPLIVAISVNRPLLFSQFLTSKYADLATSARQTLDQCTPTTLTNIAKAWNLKPDYIEPLKDREPLIGLTALFSKDEVPFAYWLPIAFAEARVLESREKTEPESQAFQKVLRDRLTPGQENISRFIEALNLAVRDHRFGEHHRLLMIAYLKAGLSFAEHAETLQQVLHRAWQLGIPLENWASVVHELVRRLGSAGRPEIGSKIACDWLVAVLQRRAGDWSVSYLTLIDQVLDDDRGRLCEEVVRRVSRLPKTELWEAFLTRTCPFFDHYPSLNDKYQIAIVARSVEDGRDILEAFQVVLTQKNYPDFDRGHPALSQEACDHIAELARGVLPSGQGRAASLIRLLTDRSRPFWFQEALEQRLLESEKASVLPFLASELPHFDKLEKVATKALLMKLASWLGEAWRYDKSGSRRFIQRAVEKKHFDVAGAFLRSAERLNTGFLEQADEGLKRKLRRVLNHPSRWTDLGQLEKRIS